MNERVRKIGKEDVILNFNICKGKDCDLNVSLRKVFEKVKVYEIIVDIDEVLRKKLYKWGGCGKKKKSVDE